jgi:hypothetical protein
MIAAGRFESIYSIWEFFIKFFKFFKSFVIHTCRTFFNYLKLAINNTIVKLVLWFHHTNKIVKHVSPHKLLCMSLYPISRLTEAFKPNQPIGTIGTGDRLLMKLLSLGKMRSSVPFIFYIINYNLTYNKKT